MLVTRSNVLTTEGFVQQYGSLSGFWPLNHPNRAKAAILAVLPGDDSASSISQRVDSQRLFNLAFSLGALAGGKGLRHTDSYSKELENFC